MLHTNLVETALIREDGDVSVVACASCAARAAVSMDAASKQWIASNAPDMMAGSVVVYL